MNEVADSLASALGRIPSGLFVITACQENDCTGMLVSWVQQCSFDPPQVTVAIRRDRFIGSWLVDGAAFILNQLSAGDTRLLAHFGKGFAAGEPAFNGIKTIDTDLGVPAISQSLAHLYCRVIGRCPAGDHDLVVGRVLAGSVRHDDPPYVHVRKNGLKY